MNQVGQSMVLQERAGSVSDGGVTVLGVGIKTALVGTLTVTGIANSDGTAASWVVAGGSSGLIQAPGSGKSGGNAINYSYANAADQGKAFVAWY